MLTRISMLQFPTLEAGLELSIILSIYPFPLSQVVEVNGDKAYFIELTSDELGRPSKSNSEKKFQTEKHLCLLAMDRKMLHEGLSPNEEWKTLPFSQYFIFLGSVFSSINSHFILLIFV